MGGQYGRDIADERSKSTALRSNTQSYLAKIFPGVQSAELLLLVLVHRACLSDEHLEMTRRYEIKVIGHVALLEYNIPLAVIDLRQLGHHDLRE
jgi:hypothetical protein